MIPEKELKNYQSIPFWSWNDKLEPEELRRQIRNMKKAGIGGFFMHARGGLLTEYMGEDWMKAVETCIDEAEKQDMNAWCYDENGWPSGFAGMKLLEDPANFAHYLTCEEKPAFDPEALACYRLAAGHIVRIFKDDGKACYCLYDRTNSSVVDILNPDIVHKFIRETHEKYYERFGKDFGKYMAGFFTDEPQYFRWDTAYSSMMLSAYRGRYGEDLLEDLGALFIECEESHRLRYRYWRMMCELFTENFAGQIYEWCDEHDCKLTGHAIEESSLFGQMIACAGIMPFYEYEHIPGMDWLGRDISTEMAPRQVYSAATQLGKKHVLTETFACAGWDVTPKELKRIAEWQYVNGVNLMCQHLYPYSIRGQRKRDYPAFYSEHNPWTTEFKHFNDYFTCLGYMLAESDEEAEVAVIHPIHSAYFDYKRNDHKTLDTLEKSFRSLIETLGAMGVGHQFVDEYLLEKYGYVEGDALVMGEKKYHCVVLPDMAGLDGYTAELLDEYVMNGGKIWLQGKCPDYVDGEKVELGYQSNISVDDLLNPACLISDRTTEIRSTLRRWKEGDFLYAVNLSKDKTYSVNYRIKAQGVSRFDLETGEKRPLFFQKEGEYVNLPLTFAPGASFVVMLDGAAAADAPVKEKKLRSLGTQTKIVNGDDNILTVDMAALSYDGVEYTAQMPIMAISDRLLRERTNRKVYLKYVFTVTKTPASLRLEAEKMGAVSVKVNGQPVEMIPGGSVDISDGVCDVLPLVKVGENEVVFEIEYYQSEHNYQVFNGVYYDHDGTTESMINCLSYLTDVEAIYLLGDFGVECTLEKGEKNTRICQDGKFAIVKSNKDVDAAHLAETGYPFFSGSVTFEKEIEADGTETVLELPGRYAVAKVEIGGETRLTMFDDKVDVTGLLKPGKNAVKITLICARRNSLGPHHSAGDPEPFAVGPDSFTLYGTWKDGKSPRYAERYAFTFFGLEDIRIG